VTPDPHHQISLWFIRKYKMSGFHKKPVLPSSKDDQLFLGRPFASKQISKLHKIGTSAQYGSSLPAG
jgi:hypothetical protein